MSDGKCSVILCELGIILVDEEDNITGSTQFVNPVESYRLIKNGGRLPGLGQIIGKIGNDLSAASNQEAVNTTEIPRVILRSAAEFEAIVKKGKPVVIERLDLGPCVQTWTAEHMAEQVGAEREVSSFGISVILYSYATVD